jgi:hypothetical protein
MAAATTEAAISVAISVAMDLATFIAVVGMAVRISPLIPSGTAERISARSEMPRSTRQVFAAP